MRIHQYGCWTVCLILLYIYRTTIANYSFLFFTRFVFRSHFTVSLTLDFQTPQEYFNQYGGRVGMLTALVDGVLHRIGKVIAANRKTLALCLCRQLGYKSGTVTDGPWLRLTDGMFSRLRSWCDADMKDVLECSAVVETKNISEMAVDIFICEHTEESMFTFSRQDFILVYYNRKVGVRIP